MQYNLPTASVEPVGHRAGPDGNLWFTETARQQDRAHHADGHDHRVPDPDAQQRSASRSRRAPTATCGSPSTTRTRSGASRPRASSPSSPWARTATPGSIAAGADGNLWFTEAGGANAIGRVTPMGGVSEYAVPTAGERSDGITAGPDKNLWFTELSTNKIGRVSDLAGGGTLRELGRQRDGAAQRQHDVHEGHRLRVERQGLRRRRLQLRRHAARLRAGRLGRSGLVRAPTPTAGARARARRAARRRTTARRPCDRAHAGRRRRSVRMPVHAIVSCGGVLGVGLVTAAGCGKSNGLLPPPDGRRDWGAAAFRDVRGDARGGDGGELGRQHQRER